MSLIKTRIKNTITLHLHCTKLSFENSFTMQQDATQGDDDSRRTRRKDETPKDEDLAMLSSVLLLAPFSHLVVFVSENSERILKEIQLDLNMKLVVAAT